MQDFSPSFLSELVHPSLLVCLRGGDTGSGGDEGALEFSNILFMELTLTAGT